MDWAVWGSDAGGGDIFILQNVQADPGAHPDFCSVDTASKVDKARN